MSQKYNQASCSFRAWMILKSKLQNGYKHFCDDTSLHGFAQLYYAESIFWSLFWIVCVTISIVMTIYQVVIAIDQYMDQGSMTVIRIATDEEIVYPPLKICHTHWLQWISFDKAYSMNFTKESVLYGLSFLTNIYSLDNFNVTDARLNFTETMRQNNLTTMTQFYKAVSKYAPLRSWEDELYRENYSRDGGSYFKNAEFVMYQQGNLLLCHVQKGQEIRDYIKQAKLKSDNPTNANILRFSLNDQHMFKAGSSTLREIESDEYNSYIAEWIESMTPQYWIHDETKQFEHVKQNYTTFDSPLVIFPNGFCDTGMKVSTDVDEYFITVRASVHNWKNTKKFPCKANAISVASDSSCTKACIGEMKYKNSKKAKFAAVYYLNRDEPENLFRNKISFIENETFANETTLSPTTAPPQAFSTSPTPNRLETTTSAKISSKNCTEKCLQGCTRWTFDVSVTSGSMYYSIKELAEKRRTNVQIDYPIDGDILVMVETDSQTWENFVGSVGGLLGIWTGASLLSFCQMFYLCCCADSEGPCDCLTMKKKRGNEEGDDIKREPTIMVPIKCVKTISSEPF